ncbi:MAG: hypothetical protein COB74_01975 [Shewanella sp.]|nr:MAG: hypothetical protein COB74_01975 [Shewanella sp.]
MDSGLRRKDEKEKYDKLPHNLAMLLLTENGANALIAQRLTGRSPYSSLFLLTESAANVLIAQCLKGQSPSLHLITFTYSLRSKRPFLTLKG